MTRRLNLKKWNEKRIPIEEQITALKALIATPGRGGSSDEYFQLGRLQDDATILYMARAEQRNKLHATIMISYWHDPKMDPGNVVDGYNNVMVKVINPVDREYQQKMISDRQDLLADLYKEVPDLQAIKADFDAVQAIGPVITEPLANRPYPAPVAQTWEQLIDPSKS